MEERIIHIPKNVTNAEVVKIVFDERCYLAIKARLEHTLWWNSPYSPSLHPNSNPYRMIKIDMVTEKVDVTEATTIDSCGSDDV